jgi:acyl-CoA synthetase (AMP-forming)/AMP-acid ligase II
MSATDAITDLPFTEAYDKLKSISARLTSDTEYKRLADVIVLDEIPRSPAGKLLRRVLVERERADSAVPLS